MAQVLNAAETTPRFTIVGLGDSTTAGTPGFFSPREAPPEGRGDPKSQYAYWIMQEHPEWLVLNRGVRGQRTDQILARFDYDVLRYQPDAVIVLAGVNDLHQGRSVEETRQGLEMIYERVLAADLKLIVCTILPYDFAVPEVSERIRKVNDWIREYAERQNLFFCDTYQAVADPERPGKLKESPDQIHPGVAGYKSMAEALIPVLSKIFKESAKAS